MVAFALCMDPSMFIWWPDDVRTPGYFGVQTRVMSKNSLFNRCGGSATVRVP